jgi:hypothetical protein
LSFAPSGAIAGPIVSRVLGKEHDGKGGNDVRPIRLLVLLLAGIAALVASSGCFAPRGPDPLQQLLQEKNEAVAECNEQIATVVRFYGKNADIMERAIRTLKACEMPGQGNRPKCAAAVQRYAHAASELNGQDEPDCATHMDGCVSAAKQFVQTETCFHEKFLKPYMGICPIEDLSEKCILALDEGAMCLPRGPDLSACNRLAKIETQAKELAGAWHEREAPPEPPVIIREAPAPIPPVFTHCTNVGPTMNCITQ